MKIKFILLMLIVLYLTNLNSLQIFLKDISVQSFDLSTLREFEQQNFVTIRDKNGKQINENWIGINLNNWLSSMNLNEFENIRFESADNYIIQLHKAELDTMNGFIALKRENLLLDESEIRLIFPDSRDMYWVRGISKIYLEEFIPIPSPQKIYTWEAVYSGILGKKATTFNNTKGYNIDDLMHSYFRMDSGSVVFVSRDGLKARYDYAKHLKGSVIDDSVDSTLNLMSPILPHGLWLKDIVYIQSGPYAIIKYDYLYRLTYLAELLQWDSFNHNQILVKSEKQLHHVPLETIYEVLKTPLTMDQWIELH